MRVTVLIPAIFQTDRDVLWISNMQQNKMQNISNKQQNRAQNGVPAYVRIWVKEKYARPVVLMRTRNPRKR